MNMAREMRNSGLSAIGVVPSDWHVARGKNVLMPLSRPVKDDDGVITCFRDGEVTLRSNRRTDGFTVSLKEMGYQGIEPGDLAVHGMDGFAGAIGISDSRGKASPVLNVLDSSQNKRYLMYYLRALAYREVYLALADGIRVRSCNLSWKKISELPILLPPIDEQQRIANYLDAKCTEIDGAIKSAESSISDYKAYRNALVYQTVMHGMSSHSQSVKESGVSYIGTIPQNWSCVPIKMRFEIVKRIAGRGGFKVLSITQKGLKPKDFSTGKGQFARSYDNYQIVEPGDFAMNHMDLVTGWVDLSSQLGVTSPDYRVFKARDESMEKRYYLYVFQSYYSALVFYGFGKGISGKGRWRLPAPAFYSTMIPVPPLNEQHVIADYLDAKCSIIDEAITSKQSIIDDLKAYKQSLIYEVVTGKREV